MSFLSREEAGRELGEKLVRLGVKADVALGLPRGGVVVASEAARILNCPLDVLIVRKIGHPRHREFAVGALAESGVVLLDSEAMRETGVRRQDLQDVIAEETKRMDDYQQKFHQGLRHSLAGRSALVIDDGLATGATAEAAVTSARKQNARAVFVAVPVASPGAMERLRQSADDVFSLMVDPDFMAVGQYYRSFPQTSDDEVIALLNAGTLR